MTKTRRSGVDTLAGYEQAAAKLQSRPEQKRNNGRQLFTNTMVKNHADCIQPISKTLRMLGYRQEDYSNATLDKRGKQVEAHSDGKKDEGFSKGVDRRLCNANWRGLFGAAFRL